LCTCKRGREGRGLSGKLDKCANFRSGHGTLRVAALNVRLTRFSLQTDRERSTVAKEAAKANGVGLKRRRDCAVGVEVDEPAL
jgi:hypothetical protein